MTFSDPYFLTGLGSAVSIFFSTTGSAIASTQGGIYALRNKGPKAFFPIIVSGVLAIYGLIISIILVGNMGKVGDQQRKELTEIDGYAYLSAGLSVGLACLASGFGIARYLEHLNKITIGKSDDTFELEPLLQGERHPKKENFVQLCTSLCFLLAIGFYGLVVALFIIG